MQQIQNGGNVTALRRPPGPKRATRPPETLRKMKLRKHQLLVKVHHPRNNRVFVKETRVQVHG